MLLRSLPPTLLSVLLFVNIGFGASAYGRRSAETPRPETAAGTSIAVADFTGADKELGRFLSDTLLTDLAHSDRLSMVERGEIRQAFAELKLQASGLAEPSQVQKLGRLVSADHLIVGSYLVRDDQIIVNARLLDVKTGRLALRGAANVSGGRNELLALTHRLARQFHKRLTGSDLSLDSDEASLPSTDDGVEPDAEPVAVRHPSLETTSDTLKPLQVRGLAPVSARPSDPVRERDLIALVGNLSRAVALQTDNPVGTTQPNAPVTRIRALTALVKLLASPDLVASYRGKSSEELPIDASQAPAWGLPYTAAAVDQGWWPKGRALRARETATWAFLATLITKMPFTDAVAAPRRSRLEQVSDPEAYTGLVVDAGDFRVERSMNVRILDQSGNVLYPDPRNVPDYDFLLDNGMAAYCNSLRDARRAGGRPLVVRAIDRAGSVGADLVVSSRTAERIRQANRSGQFLSRWAVCVLVDARD